MRRRCSATTIAENFSNTLRAATKLTQNFFAMVMWSVIDSSLIFFVSDL